MYMLLVFTIQKQESKALQFSVLQNVLSCMFSQRAYDFLTCMSLLITLCFCDTWYGTLLHDFPRGIEPQLIHVSEFFRTRTRVTEHTLGTATLSVSGAGAYKLQETVV